jgi:uncharacterized protein GlcG (DUF336 family)
MLRHGNNQHHRLAVDVLEDRCIPALIASQVQAVLTPPVLTPGNVQALLVRAATATASNDAIIAIVDRGGKILGVFEESGVSAAIKSTPAKNDFAIDGAVSLARTAAFFANDTAPLTSRTVQDLSQSTITQREVESDPNITDPNSVLRGPGFVAPIGIGGHFPPGVSDAGLADLFDIEGTNRDSYLQPGADAIKGTPDDIPLPDRFNINPAFVPAGKAINAPLAYGETLLTAAGQRSPAVNHFQSRGIATLPGGIPLYKYGVLVGGIGVFFPGTTGFATAENSSLSTLYNPKLPDRTLEAEFIGLAAEGGSSALGLRVGTLGNIARVAGFDFPSGRIDLGGITLDIVGPGGAQGPFNLVTYAKANLGVGKGSGAGTFLPVDAVGDTLLGGATVPSGWLVTPHAGGHLSAADVQLIIHQGIATANQTRAQIRLPSNMTTRMVFAVTDTSGNVLGLYRMPDATVFSIGVAVAKARNDAYYNDPAQLQASDQLPGLPKGVAMTSRDYRYLASPRYPVAVDGTLPGPFSILNDSGTNPLTALNTGSPVRASVFQSVLGYDSFHPNTNFRDPFNLANQNGVVFFPGSSGIYKFVGGHMVLVGGLGVSGDGVTQDDFVTSGAVGGYDAPTAIRADQYFFRGVRLPYFNFPRNPEDF